MDIQQQLKANNLSITPVRVAMLETLAKNQHIEANKIFALVQQKISTTSIQAVYKNLHTLVENGLIREIKPKGSSALYETRVNDNHQHLVCRSCGSIEDTNCLDSAPCLTSTDLHGFKIDETEIIFWGYCPKCQK